MKDLCRRKEYDASIAVCDAAFRRDPDGQLKEYWEAFNCKASCYEKSRRLSEARECYGRCAEDAKASPDAKKVARRALKSIEEMERMNTGPSAGTAACSTSPKTFAAPFDQAKTLPH